MSLEQMLMVGAAGAVALWPGVAAGLRRVAAYIRNSRAEVVAEKPGFQAAIANLALVRARLAGTELLDDAAKKAIDTLTLALVSGSDK